ncbi:MAG: hypothetical protein CMN84_08365 [Spongiibacteraceae bacterium]|jgi:cyclopropane fatty-acyl-phospholipid synthase-like methyltransferase|nr:hypothetical protein [Spongiibacteraceae bacterium]
MGDIELLAAEIATQTISQSWPYYALVVALTLVSGAFGAFASAYLSRRAEHQAILADFDSIKAQLRETTTLTESIRYELSHQFDRTHTIEILRRQKLEAYLEKVSEAAENLHKEMNVKIFNSEEQFDPSAFSSACMFQTMYLPEFDLVHANFQKAYADYKLWLVEGMKYIQQKKSEGQQIVPPTQEFMAKQPQHLKSVLSAVTAIEAKAREVGRELINVERGANEA